MERLARLDWLAPVANELSMEARVQYSYTPGGHIFCRCLKLLASSELLRTPSMRNSQALPFMERLRAVGEDPRAALEAMGG